MKGHSVCVRSIMKKDLTEIVFILDRSGSFSCRNVSVGRKCGILNSTNLANVFVKSFFIDFPIFFWKKGALN